MSKLIFNWILSAFKNGPKWYTMQKNISSLIFSKKAFLVLTQKRSCGRLIGPC